MTQLLAHRSRPAVRTLGPLELVGRGRDIRVRRLKARQLLLVLLVQSNRLVPREALIDALWSGDLPRHHKDLVLAPDISSRLSS